MKPKIICICGSTRFADLHAVIRWELEKQGNICLMINYLPKEYIQNVLKLEDTTHLADQLGLRDALDILHLRKIDLSDEIFVVNKDGYVGGSTRREIEYAKSLGKPVKYLETKKYSQQ